MKNLTLTLLAAVLLTSCKKSAIPGDSGCISRITGHYNRIKASDSLAAIAMLDQNSIAHNDLTLSFVSLDTVPAGPNIGTYMNVFAVQNINGLPVLSGDLFYQFKNGTLQSLTGKKYGATNLNTYAVLSLPQLRDLYLKAAKANNSLIANLADTCLVARFGYYDLDANTGQSPNFVKAWIVKPKSSDFPEVVLQDGNGKTITYYSGVILY